jgi:cytochrome c biogenesis protein CcdA/thiol-disulfide isomerase/thioredoxin
MALLVLAYFGGILTIISPCILPVLPFVFSRADRPFWKSGFPLLAGMALTFATVASLAVFGGGWIVRLNEYGRMAAVAALVLFAGTLLSPGFAEWLTRPLVRLGSRLSRAAEPPTAAGEGYGGIPQSILLGVATGLLWAPCAGPILGLVLTGAAAQGPSAQTSLLLLAYAAGAITSLAPALLLGGRVFSLMKRSLGAEIWIRRGIGIAVLAGAAAVALGLDSGVLARLSIAGTSGIEQSLIGWLRPPAAAAAHNQAAAANQDAGPANRSRDPRMPSLSGASGWINSPRLTRDSLRGKVVLIDFWTYSCINCLRSLPYIRAWNEKYKKAGLVVIGVHTPEFPFEKVPANVEKAVRELGISYPVALDDNYKIWTAFHNEYWPAHYFVDAAGRIVYQHFGEGDYAQSEQWIQQLLAQRNGAQPPPQGIVQVTGTGVEEASNQNEVSSPETYLGYARAANFAPPETLEKDRALAYRAPAHLDLNQWGLGGNWVDNAQTVTLVSGTGTIRFRFHARDLHLVLGPSSKGRSIRFRILLDGQAPGSDHGVDANAQGAGAVTDYRLYQLLRLQNAAGDHTFEIQFLDPGVQAYSFTFG